PDLEYSSIEDQTNELTSSKAYLDSQLNQETIAIAYPGGRYSADTVSLTEQAGYKLGVTTNNGLASASDGLLTLNRVRILPTTTAEGLLSEISY
ncbi:polysaccharide deacetylase family protein, partial [Streptococcus suis]